MVRLNSVHLSYWVQQMNVSYGHTSGFSTPVLHKPTLKDYTCVFVVSSIRRYITIVLPMQKYCLHS